METLCLFDWVLGVGVVEGVVGSRCQVDGVSGGPVPGPLVPVGGPDPDYFTEVGRLGFGGVGRSGVLGVAPRKDTGRESEAPVGTPAGGRRSPDPRTWKSAVSEGADT